MADNMKTDELINKASSLIQQFEKVLSQIEPRKARAATVAAEVASSNDPKCGNVAGNQHVPHNIRQQPQQQQCRGNDSMINTASFGISQSDTLKLIATNESNYTGCCGGACASQRVGMESSEIRLILTLDTWMSDTGTLMIRPSISVDSGYLSAKDSKATASPAAGKLQTIPTAVKAVQCGGDNSDEEGQVANEPIPKQMRKQMRKQQEQQTQPQKQQQQQQQQSKRRLRNLNNGHQEIGIQLGTVNTGGRVGCNQAKLPTRKTIPTAVKAVQCCSNTSDEESQAAFVATHPQQSQKQQQQQSDRRLQNLSNGVREIANQLGAVNSGGRRARAGNLDKLPTRPDCGLATGSASFAVHQSDGDGRRRSSHHDNVSDPMSDQSEANSFSSDQSAISPEGDCDACAQPEEPPAESTGALLQRLLGLIEKDSSPAMHPRE